jgi:hypothetical protein
MAPPTTLDDAYDSLLAATPAPSSGCFARVCLWLGWRPVVAMWIVWCCDDRSVGCGRSGPAKGRCVIVLPVLHGHVTVAVVWRVL